jgi:hypothetical protein
MKEREGEETKEELTERLAIERERLGEMALKRLHSGGCLSTDLDILAQSQLVDSLFNACRDWPDDSMESDDPVESDDSVEQN